MTAVSCTHRFPGPRGQKDREMESALESLLTGDTTTHADHRGTLSEVSERTMKVWQSRWRMGGSHLPLIVKPKPTWTSRMEGDFVSWPLNAPPRNHLILWAQCWPQRQAWQGGLTMSSFKNSDWLPLPHVIPRPTSSIPWLLSSSLFFRSLQLPSY